jgi:hypothetical protein
MYESREHERSGEHSGIGSHTSLPTGRLSPLGERCSARLGERCFARLGERCSAPPFVRSWLQVISVPDKHRR